MKIKNVSVPSFQGATTPQALASAVRAQGGYLGPELSTVLGTISKSQWVRWMLAAISVVLIIGATYYSFEGAKFIWPDGKYLSIPFCLLDIVLVVLIASRVLTETWKKWGAILFEIVTLVFFGYTLTGNFLKGNVEPVISQQIIQKYDQARKIYYTPALTLNSSTNNARATAESVQDAELLQDGVKGIVYQKGGIIAGLSTEAVPDFPTPPTVPAFNDLPSANSWMQQQMGKLNAEMEKYKGVSESLVQQGEGAMKGVQAGFEAAKESKLSDTQVSNLRQLEEVLRPIAEYKVPSEKITADNFTPGDFELGKFQSVAGYIVDGIIFALLVLMAFLGEVSYDMKTLKEEAEITKREQALYAHGINTSDLGNLSSLEANSFASKVEKDETFRAYVTQNGNLTDVIEIFKLSPRIAELLPISSWKAVDVKALLANQELKDHAEEVILIQPSDWKKVSGLVPVSKAIEISKNPESVKKLLEIADMLRKKLRYDEAELKKHLDNLLVDQPRLEYLEVVEYLCQKLSEKRLKTLDRGFISLLDVKTAKLLISSIGNSNRLEEMVLNWSSESNELLQEMMENEVDKDIEFSMLMQCALQGGGTDGFKRVSGDFQRVLKEKNQAMLGNKSIKISAAKVNAMRNAAEKNLPTEFNAATVNLFVLESVTVTV